MVSKKKNPTSKKKTPKTAGKKKKTVSTVPPKKRGGFTKEANNVGFYCIRIRALHKFLPVTEETFYKSLKIARKEFPDRSLRVEQLVTLKKEYYVNINYVLFGEEPMFLTDLQKPHCEDAAEHEERVEEDGGAVDAEALDEKLQEKTEEAAKVSDSEEDTNES